MNAPTEGVCLADVPHTVSRQNEGSSWGGRKVWLVFPFPHICGSKCCSCKKDLSLITSFQPGSAASLCLLELSAVGIEKNGENGLKGFLTKSLWVSCFCHYAFSPSWWAGKEPTVDFCLHFFSQSPALYFQLISKPSKFSTMNYVVFRVLSYICSNNNDFIASLDAEELRLLKQQWLPHLELQYF